MNKTKKFAFAAVSVVMAGAMAMSMVACGEKNDDKGNNPGSGTNTGSTIDANAVNKILTHMSTDSQGQVRENTLAGGWNTAKSYWEYLSGATSTTVADEYGVLNSDGTINYNAYSRSSEVTLNLGIGHNSTITSTSFRDLGGQITLPDGKNYEDGNMKPAWVQLGKDLNISFNDVYLGKATNANLKEMITTKDEKGNKVYDTTDLFTTDLSYAVQYAASGTSILNLADYLDYMPNFRKFLESNPIVYLSLLQADMSTTDGSGKVIYVAPYFDGNDDIERYCIIRQDWAAKLLNGSASLSDSATFKAACGENVSVSSYMYATGKLEIESTNKEGTGKTTIVKNYTAVLDAVKAESTPLSAAYQAIAGAAYEGDSGNIVDIMNVALKANPEATGDQLVALFRAYIDVCYQDTNGNQYYSADRRADLFNGYDACWDADDLVAILRCVKTNAKALTGTDTVEGIVPRSGQNDRTPDMVRLAGQLYGVRGTDSRYEYTYIDKDGKLQDSRNDKELYVALAQLNTLKQENLIADYSGISSFSFAQATNKAGTTDAFMMYDYSQTQTLNGFYAEDSNLTGKTLAEGYYFAPIVNPVSKWTVNEEDDTIMRFTESWRSVKTSGLCLNGSLAKAGNEEKLKAALQLVDYLYSEDGQIVSTYGPMATDANGTGGFWYNTEATTEEKTAGKYFTYKGVKYSGTLYKGKYTPTITSKLYDSFKGLKVNNFSVKDNSKISAAALSFTNYARYLIGATLPVGVKDQSLENQLTSKMGQSGANKVGVALSLGTIKGLTLEIKSDNYWYTCVPTSLPIASNIVNDILNNANMQHLMYLTGTQKTDKNFLSIFNYIILNGLKGTYNQQDEQFSF